MANRQVIDLDFFPPFEGFPQKGITFLKQLKKNNRRDWFESHRSDFESFVKLPMQSLIAALGPHFQSFAPEYEVSPKRSLFRIYRDVRFSKDKRPYKTHVAAHFVLRGKSKGTEGSGYYVHVEPGEVFVGAGIYMPDNDQLKKIRKRIADHSAEFLAVVNDRKMSRVLGKLEGERLQRVPKGYDPDHPMAEWLKLKQFFVGTSWPEKRCLTAGFIKDVAKAFEAASPLVAFLNKALR